MQPIHVSMHVHIYMTQLLINVWIFVQPNLQLVPYLQIWPIITILVLLRQAVQTTHTLIPIVELAQQHVLQELTKMANIVYTYVQMAFIWITLLKVV
jgi:hypothetical protein